MEDQVFQFAFSFLRQEPRAAARLLEEMELPALSRFLVNIPVPLALLVLKEMLPSTCASLFSYTDVGSVTPWMAGFPNNHLCAILRNADKTQQLTLLEQLSIKRRAACQMLLTYSDTMVGAWVETDMPVLFHDMTLDDAIKRIRKRDFKETHLLVVCDAQRRPLGTVSSLELLRHPHDQLVGALDRVVHESLSGRLTLLAAVSHPLWQQRDLAIVVNRQRELVGILWFSQVRRQLSSQQAWSGAEQDDPGSVTRELLQAHSESMREVIDLFRRALF